MSANQYIKQQTQLAEELISELCIDAEESRDLTQQFLEKIQSAYDYHKEHGSTKKFDVTKQDFMALDTCVKYLPDGRESGVYYGVDLGGSNLRVLRCKLNGDGTTELFAVKENARTFDCGLPFGLLDPKATATMLFDFIAAKIQECITKCGDENTFLSIGFCFSFAVEQLLLDRAICVGMGKGWNTGEDTDDCIIGSDVTAMLNKALRRNHIQGRVVGCLNDTTGTCLTAAYEKEADLPPAHMGVIIGTGFNICLMDDKALHHGYQGAIVNLESGGFKQMRRTIVDLDVDLASTNKGRQTCEKMVSGLFIPELCRFAILRVFRSRAPAKAWTPNVFETADCLQVFNKNTTEERLKFCRHLITETLGWDDVTHEESAIVTRLIVAVIERSAVLSGVCISACAMKTDRLRGVFGGVTAGIDGSVYCLNPKYQETMQVSIDNILGNRASMLRIVMADDGSGKGAAMLASAVPLKPADVFVKAA